MVLDKKSGCFRRAREKLRERIHLLLIDEAAKGLDDVAAGRVKDTRDVLKTLKRRRSS